MLPRFIRNASFRFVKSDLLQFLEEHEDDFLALVYAELENLDARMPEEKMYIDIHMAELGQEISRGIFRAVRDFLKNY